MAWERAWKGQAEGKDSRKSRSVLGNLEKKCRGWGGLRVGERGRQSSEFARVDTGSEKRSAHGEEGREKDGRKA